MVKMKAATILRVFILMMVFDEEVIRLDHYLYSELKEGEGVFHVFCFVSRCISRFLFKGVFHVFCLKGHFARFPFKGGILPVFSTFPLSRKYIFQQYLLVIKDIAVGRQ